MVFRDREPAEQKTNFSGALIMPARISCRACSGQLVDI
jgi:hypothetical protein